MVLVSFQCRGRPTSLAMVRQGPAVVAAGAGRVGFFSFFYFSSRLFYLPVMILIIWETA